MSGSRQNDNHQPADQNSKSKAVQECPACGMKLPISIDVCPNDGTVLKHGLRIGPKIAEDYEFIEELGSGGMGVVYKARHLALNKFVAIKMLHAFRADPIGLKRFQQEARAVSSLDHPGIVRVRDFGVNEVGQPHIVLDFIEGETLAQLIEENGPVSVPTATDIFIQACDALAHAHQRGILHRDLKPANFMLVPHPDNTYEVKVVDFGIAKVLEPDQLGKNLTQTGEIFGSPVYMSPEQASGRNVDHRSDIYSMGCVLFEALIGVPPFEGNNPIEILLQQMNDEAPTLKSASLGKEFPAELEAIVAQSLRKNADERFQSMTEFKEALIHSRTGKRHHSLIDRKKTVSSKIVKHDLSLIIASSAVLILVGACGYLVWKSQQPSGAVDTKTETPLQLTRNVNSDDVARLVVLKAKGEKTIKVTGMISEPTFQLFDDDKYLREVDFDGASFTGPELAHLIHLPLQVLKLSHNRFLSDLTQVGLMKHLQVLSLDKTDISLIANGMEPLQEMKELTTISMQHAHLTDSTLKQILPIKSLADINIVDNNKLTAAALVSLETLPKLKVLTLDARQFEALGRTVNGFKNLQTLIICTDLAEAAPSRITFAPDAEALPVSSLTLIDCNVTNEELSKLRTNKCLKELKLEGCKGFTDDVLEQLRAKGIAVINDKVIDPSKKE